MLITLRSVTVQYTREPVLERVNLVVEEGDRVCLIGRNGAGKSTLLKLLAGDAERPTRARWNAATACAWPSCRRTCRATSPARSIRWSAPALARAGGCWTNTTRRSKPAPTRRAWTACNTRSKRPAPGRARVEVDALLTRMGLPAEARIHPAVRAA